MPVAYSVQPYYVLIHVAAVFDPYFDLVLVKVFVPVFSFFLFTKNITNYLK